MNSICTKVPIRRPLLQAVAVLGITAGLLAGMQPAWAGTTGGVCMVERFNVTKPANATDLNCTSNDVQLAQYTVVSGPAACLEGQEVTLTLQGEFLATAAERWDVGVFIHENGGTPNSLPSSVDDTCYSDYLNPVSADNTDLNLTGGAGPFYNGEITEDPGDLCGDIQQGQNAFLDTDQITIVCQDDDNNGTADVGTCTVWANSRSAGSDLKPSCIDEGTSDPADQGQQGVTAETTAKCTCGNVEISGLTVLKVGFLEVIKEVLPDGFVYDNDAFDLQIDDVTEFEDAQDGDTTGKKIVSAGSIAEPGVDHTVGEVAGANTGGLSEATDLANYDISIECVDRDTTNVRASGTGSGPLTVNVLPDADIVCTITNQLKPAMVLLNKTQSGGVIPLDQSFLFAIYEDDVPFPDTTVNDGVASATITGDGTGASDSTDFGAVELLPGVDYALCEDVMVGWMSSLSLDPNMFAPQGGDPDASNLEVCVNFTVDPGGVTLTFPTVDNTPPPGGDAKTIGFWKNWTSCDGHGNQDPVLDGNLPVTIGNLTVTTCEVAVDLLDKRDIGDPGEVRDGRKKAGDAAYGLAAQLLAAKLNLVAQAGTCQALADAIAAADALLSDIGFDGTGNYLKGGNASDDRALATELAGILDDYNNNELCN